ncbi:MAG: histidine phosphatase family protein [Parachlamydiaceae bacterium]
MISHEPIHLILARHGNTFEKGQKLVQVGSKTDMPLTGHGRVQAEFLGKYLAERQITPRGLYAGGLKRQIETAKIVGKELHFKGDIHEHEPALTEVDYGLWEGLTQEEIMEKWPLEYSAWTEESAWGEEIFGGTVRNHLIAIEKWLNKLREEYSSGDTVIGITSNGIIRFFYSFHDEEWSRLKKGKQMDILKVSTGHFCEILLFKNSISIKSWNVNPKE